jgi:hypothetical protein
MYEYEGLPPPCCPECKRIRDEQFYIVREVIREFPGIPALHVHHATEVPMEVILRFAENGMIEVVPTVNKDGQLDERIGLMIRRAAEIRKTYGKPAEKEDVLKIDEMSINELKDKFTWRD